MKSYDYDAVTYDGEVYCVGHLPAGISCESEGVNPIFADDEVDYPPCCDHCHVAHTYMNILQPNVTAEVRRKAGVPECEKLPAHAFPGGYTLIYVTDDGNVLCPDCADENDWDSAPVVAVELYQEGPPIECDGGCGTMIESDYGDPDNPKD